MKNGKRVEMDTLFFTLWVIGYFALYAVLIYMYVRHKADIKMGSIFAAGIVGHTVLLGYTLIFMIEEAWPGKFLFGKLIPKGYEGFNFYFCALAIGILILIIAIVWCIVMKSKGIFMPKYLLISPAVAVADFILLRLLSEVFELLSR